MNIYESEETEVKKLKSVITEFSQESQEVNSWEESFTGGYLSFIGFAEVEISSESPLDRGEYLGKEVTIIVGDDEPEVLSQEFIDKYKVDYDNWMPAVPIVHLQNLLVPKQEEITEEQAWEVIRGKYGDEVLQNNIDYVESQGYVVIEKPTVPQFVADWHVQNKYYLLGAKFERIADSEDKRVVDWYRQCSGRHNNKLSNAQETIALMDLVGYEVEEEQKYYALIKGHEYIYSDICFWIYDTEIEELLIDDAEIYPDVTAGYMIKATKDEWANLGINDDNADFVKIEEMEE